MGMGIDWSNGRAMHVASTCAITLKHLLLALLLKLKTHKQDCSISIYPKFLGGKSGDARHHEFTTIRNYFIHTLDVESIGRASGLRSLSIEHWRKREVFKDTEGKVE